MKTPLAEGQIKFQTTYQLSTPPEPEIINCCIDKANLFPVFLNQKEVLVFGYFTAAVCYSYKSDNGSKQYHVATQAHNLAEVVPLKWVEEVPADYSAAKIRLEVTNPESWQCWAEPPVQETKQAGQGFPLLASFFTPRPRNLVVFVSSVIAVKLFQQEEDLPAEPPRAEEKRMPPEAAVSHSPDYPPPSISQDKLLQMLLEILFFQEQLPTTTIYGKEKPAVAVGTPMEAPKPVSGSETNGAQSGKREKKVQTKSSELRKGHINRLAGKKTILPAADIPTIGKQTISSKRSRKSSFSTSSITGSPQGLVSKTSMLPLKQKEGTDTGTKEGTAAPPITRTWPNLAKLNPRPKPPGG